MRVRTEIIAIREIAVGQSVGYGATFVATRPTRVATIAMGYADGLSRALSNRGDVLVAGRRAPIIGTVSMDMTMIDVTDIPPANVGEECVVLGSQKGPFGEAAISAEELAKTLGTIPWEVLTSISRRRAKGRSPISPPRSPAPGCSRPTASPTTRSPRSIA